MKKYFLVLSILAFATIFISCKGTESQAQAVESEGKDCSSSEKNSEACAGCPSNNASAMLVNNNPDVSIRKTDKPFVTFIELGSVNCIPCKKMQPVMEAVEEKYGDQIKVIFYDVWKADQKKYAKEYGIRLIPTQIFLDKDGREIFRHEGFFPEVEINKLLLEQGLIPNQES